MIVVFKRIGSRGYAVGSGVISSEGTVDLLYCSSTYAKASVDEKRKLIDIGLCWFQRIFGILSGRLISGHWMV